MEIDSKRLYRALREEEAILDMPNEFCQIVLDMSKEHDVEKAFSAAGHLLYEIANPWGWASVLGALYSIKDQIHGVALASIFRSVWLKYGLVAHTENLMEMIAWIKTSEGGEHFMSDEEVVALEALPEIVTVYRGVLNDPATKKNHRA
jgi:hypothetical protein